MPTRPASSAPANGEAGSALAAVIWSSTKRMSAGRSSAENTCACAVPQVGNSAIVFPGCGGATTTNPYEAISGQRNVVWFGYPHEPCENMTTGYGPPDR